MSAKKTDPFQIESPRDFERGQWRALNDVLGYLNTLEDKMVDKTEIYKAVMAMKPAKSE
jgi:hypothetical protein